MARVVPPCGESSFRELLSGLPKKMGLVLLKLYLLVEFSIAAASGMLNHETACGKYLISNSQDHSHEIFYIDGKLVDRYFFCKAMRDDYERQCFVSENLRNKYCQSLGTIRLLFGFWPLSMSYLCGFSVLS